MQDTRSVECSNCGFVFQNEELNKPIEERKPCPKCGSLNRNIRFTHKETLELHEYRKLKAKKPTSTHKKHRADYEFEEGEKIGRNGKLVSIERIIDRDSDRYKEIVKNKHGQVIVNKDEKLSKHREG